MKKGYLFILSVFTFVVGTFYTIPNNVKAVSTVLKVEGQNQPSKVKEVQFRLKQLGFSIDKETGVYNTETQNAVYEFQKMHKLKMIDGIVGPETIGRLNKLTLSKADLNLVARAVYGESRGEPFKGQVAVAAVILNRIESKHFPNTISGVIYQTGAFTVVPDGQINLKPNESAYKACYQAIRGYDPSNGALYFFDKKTAKSKWMKNRAATMKTITIGSHTFMK